MMVYSPEGPEPPLLPPADSCREKNAQLFRKIIMTYICNNKNIIRNDLLTLKHSYVVISDFNKWWEINRLFGLSLTHKDKILVLSRCLSEISYLVQVNLTSVLPDEYNDNRIFLYM
uniref:Uncharacterized protein n=1 Tax=viral metagenome TaxID=1070528 RepID=A0A6C0JTM5_9ZZZZ